MGIVNPYHRIPRDTLKHEVSETKPLSWHANFSVEIELPAANSCLRNQASEQACQSRARM